MKKKSSTTRRQKAALILFGVFATIIGLEIVLRIGGAVFLWQQERFNLADVGPGKVIKVLCLGESTTALGGADSYPTQLEESLNSQSNEIKFKVINKGVPAITTKYIAENIKRNLDKYEPDIVITMMGINDREQGESIEMTAAKRREFLLDNFRTYRLYALLKDHLNATFFGKHSSRDTDLVLIEVGILRKAASTKPF